ncbi:MAG: ATP-dependent helicase [Bacillaceae bacterium G1]|nr:ATP-dependent helicase [Bacillota bacterium]OJF17852.1 MAG: ATP-dependent helicase [Bacillaceae bacterium G1]
MGEMMSRNDQLPITFADDWLPAFEERVRFDGPWGSWEMYQLAYEAACHTAVRSFDELQCLIRLPHLTPYPHQLETAKKVLNDMCGRAILADEVGLGKTIEAGLILKEYMVRGLVKKALILVPASLVLQWTRELNQKFHIPAVAYKKPYMWDAADILVVSMDTAKRSPNCDKVLSTAYDMLIVDEAHKLKNPRTKSYQFVRQINKKYCLLLTATPLQNDLKELFHLITLLKPGQLGTPGSFASQFMAGERQPKNEKQLQARLSHVMIRNRRSEESLPFPDRKVESVYLDLSPEEWALYDAVTRFVREQASLEAGLRPSIFSLITLQREVCSSRDAVFVTLVNMFKKLPEDSPLRAEIFRLVDVAKQVKQHTKAQKALELIETIDDKVIIFTEYRATQEFLMRMLAERGIRSVPFRGGFNRGKKDWMKDLFQNRAQVLVATEAGGEGINLQFCHHVINYDLPWNPMRLEQRIGRVHRLGQQHTVHIYNLTTNGTIEAHILRLLYEKINLFESVIGRLDDILERHQWAKTIEKKVTNLFIRSHDEQSFAEQLQKLGNQLHETVTAQHQTVERDACG